MTKLLTALSAFFHKEPAVIIGAGATVATIAAQAAAGAPSWQAALPLIAAALIRRFVSPAV